MGRKATLCPLDISDYSSSVNKGNTIFNDLWIRSYDPSRIWVPTLRTSLFTQDGNDQLLEKSLDLVDERRETAMV